MSLLPDFEYTFIPVDPSSKVPALPKGFRYDQFTYSEDYRDGDRRQAGHVTSFQAGLYVIDLDGEKPFEFRQQGAVVASRPNRYPFPQTALGALVLAWMEDGTCPLPQYTRADGENRHHLYVDARTLEEDEFPVQWATHAWAYDIKSAGFVRAEPAYVNESGTLPWVPSVEQQQEILLAVEADKLAHDSEWRDMLAESGIRSQGSGADAGDWQSDDFRIVTHDEVPGTVASMVSAGLYDSEIRQRMEVILVNREGSWPGREDYIQEKIDSARSKYGYAEGESRDGREQEFWEQWSGVPYGQLAALVLERQAAKNRVKAVEETQREAAELAEHAVAIGEPLTQLTVGQRLNPQGNLFEPQAADDTGLGRTAAEFAVVNFRLTSDEGCWLENTGTHWARWGTKSERLERAAVIVMALGDYLKPAHQLAEELGLSPTPVPADTGKGTAKSPDEVRLERLRKAHGRFRAVTGQAAVGRALVTHFLGGSGYSVRVGQLDSEPDVLWAGGQPWSLTRPQLTLATDYRYVNPVHMKTALCAPCPGPTPAFDRLLEAIWPDPEVRAWALREMAGVLLWGATSKMHPVLDGPPQGGKSTFALILTTILGSYAVQVSPDKILGGDAGSSTEEEISAMMGARMVWMDEPPPGGKQSISRFNDLASGTGDLSASRKYSNRVTSPKRFNFLICQNARNALRMDAQGVRERITHIPCEGTPATTLAARENWLRNGECEYPAILARLVYECAMYRTDNRWPVPAGAELSRDSAQERADEFGGWVLENFDQYPDDIRGNDQRLDASPTIGALRTLYNDTHARANGLPKIGRPEVEDQLRRLKIRYASAGHKRRKDVVFVQPKPVIQSMFR